GYRVGMHIKSAQDWERYQEWNLTPDYLFLPADVPLDFKKFAGPQIIRQIDGGYELVDEALAEASAPSSAQE
ncbi:MAG TPA: hypothetical protein PK011_07855, partial [Marinagarivorans sp.]|nr:hypothetical protein [Marinagarivorans sp.]